MHPQVHLNDHGQFEYHTAQTYFEQHQISTLFEALSSALALLQPADPYVFIQDCVELLKQKRASNPRALIEWDMFIQHYKHEGKTGANVPMLHGKNIDGKILETKNATKQHLPPVKITKDSEDAHAIGGLGGNLPALPHSLPMKFSSHTLPPLQGSVSRKNSTTSHNEKNGNAATAKSDKKTSGPGTGKGTQCAKIVQDSHFHHLSAGDLLRAEVAKGTELGAKLDKMMKDGLIEITLGLLKDAMLAAPESVPGFLIDGFPREIDQAVQFEQNIAPCDKVLFYDCSEKVMLERLIKRGETSGRSDDNEETIKKRFATFLAKSLPVINHFEPTGKLVKISAERGVDEVYEDSKKVFQEMSEPKIAKFEHDDAKIIFVLGGPGSGKGTQCEKISNEFGYAHLSTGDLLREQVAQKTSIGLLADSIMKQGKMVPTNLTLQLLSNAMKKSSSHKMLIDGFPRKIEQAELFAKYIRQCDLVLYYECEPSVLVERLLKRGQSSGRADDNEETIKMRIKTFNDVTFPLVKYFEDQGKLKRINATSATIDEIYEITKSYLI
ncbi:ADK-domain-containing protein [Rozella allomycis CSF55]|uniref:ADK-domain-containing protein n=1 Tax=Rozella allomycis (strain CSF55) TaxID=988480 RepID=A0A075AQI3_ROZAC|nr:Adenylate kinase domain-containing protein [Rozella allomycis CSF55]RKP18762.1 ADK-domain-containing protein [Rozella allomycis CSF55]|eukprot:EPZ30970.1 Adenylate kinase domain-containing protein [Rozella allomycis CSF55]